MPAANTLTANFNYSQTSFGKLISVWAWGAGVALLLIGFSTILHGKTGFEKSLTGLTLPIQVAWLLLSGWGLHCVSQVIAKRLPRRDLIFPGLAWALFTATGSPVVGDACFLYLETLERPFNPDVDPPLDLLVVLGGSTSQGPTRAEVGDGGDRVLLAAQLYHQGFAKRLITTGSELPQGFGPHASPAQQTLEIWNALGIPTSDTETLPGINTYAEMQSLKARMEPTVLVADGNSDQSPRVGLLTSAWHLPRALRLARAAGLERLIPVAADHRQSIEPRPFWDYIPSANGFLRLERCQRELMARLVSR